MDENECPACGGELVSWRRVPASDPALAGKTFTLRRCRTCGSAVTVEPAPPQAHETGSYAGGEPRLYRWAAPILAWFDRRRLKLIRRLVPPPARLLDAGAGRGRFVLSARAAGYDAGGIEPSARGLAGAAQLGAPVTAATIADAAIGSSTFDAVTIWHVLEHLDDPGEALDTIHAWLRPRGALLVGVPNLASVQARVGGARWYHLDVPRHRVHFTPAGLSALLERHGFELVGTTHVLAEHNPFGMWQSLVNRATRSPSYLFQLLKRNAPMTSTDLLVTAAAIPLAPIAAMIELVAGLGARGGTIAVLARRASSGPAGPGE